MVIAANEGDTHLSLKQLTPVRLIKNNFFMEVQEAEKNGASVKELENLLGKGRAKRGMFEGNLEDGELEIGQVCSLIKNIKPAAEIVHELYKEYEDTLKLLLK